VTSVKHWAEANLQAIEQNRIKYQKNAQ